MNIKNGVWRQGDCLGVMKRIPDGSVDRHWVCIERDPDYSRLAIERIAAHV